MPKHKVYKNKSWSWFYRNFINKTMSDNFFSSAEILEKQRDIITRVKRYKIKESGGTSKT